MNITESLFLLLCFLLLFLLWATSSQPFLARNPKCQDQSKDCAVPHRKVPISTCGLVQPDPVSLPVSQPFLRELMASGDP